MCSDCRLGEATSHSDCRLLVELLHLYSQTLRGASLNITPWSQMRWETWEERASSLFGTERCRGGGDGVLLLLKPLVV